MTRGTPKMTQRYELWWLRGVWALYAVPDEGKINPDESLCRYDGTKSEAIKAAWEYVLERHAETGDGVVLRWRKMNRKHPDRPGPFAKAGERSAGADSKRRPG